MRDFGGFRLQLIGEVSALGSLRLEICDLTSEDFQRDSLQLQFSKVALALSFELGFSQMAVEPVAGSTGSKSRGGREQAGDRQRLRDRGNLKQANEPKGRESSGYPISQGARLMKTIKWLLHESDLPDDCERLTRRWAAR